MEEEKKRNVIIDRLPDLLELGLMLTLYFP